MRHILYTWLILAAAIGLTACSGGNDTAAGTPPEPVPQTAPPHVDQVRIEEITQWYEAVGTVKPEVETFISSQITAKITKIMVSPGQRFQKGDVLVRLDQRKLSASLSRARDGQKEAISRKKQAQQGIYAAQATYDQARKDLDRIKKFFASEAATKSQLEQSEALFLKAKAELSRSREALQTAKAAISHPQNRVREAEITAGYAVIRADRDGEVLKRMAEPGNLAQPGRPILATKGNTAMVLEAYIREGLINQVAVGRQFTAFIPPLNRSFETVIKEIVPYADPETRTFLVKAELPRDSQLFAGMFGKLLLPLPREKIASIPAEALIRIGQLELVLVKEGDRWEKRFVKTGIQTGDRIEVVSGLSGTETIGYE
jgi:RND family efflux transporter MFP subunit